MHLYGAASHFFLGFIFSKVVKSGSRTELTKTFSSSQFSITSFTGYSYRQKYVHHVQSTLVILKSNGPSETLRDIRTSTHQVCRIWENTKRTTKFYK